MHKKSEYKNVKETLKEASKKRFHTPVHSDSELNDRINKLYELHMTATKT